MTMNSLDNNDRIFSKEQMDILLKSEDWEINSAIRLLEQSIRQIEYDKFHDENKENASKYSHWKYLANCQRNKLITELNDRNSALGRPLIPIKENSDLEALLIEAIENLEK